MKLPPPTTIANSTPNFCTSFNSFANLFKISGSKAASGLDKASPLNFNKTRLYIILLLIELSQQLYTILRYLKRKTLGISKGFKVKVKLLSHLSSNFFSKVFFAFFDTFTSLETYESYYFSLVVFQELRNLSFRF